MAASTYPTARALAEELAAELDGALPRTPNRWGGWDFALPMDCTLRVCQPDPEGLDVEAFVLMPDGGLAFAARAVTYRPGVTVALLVALAEADHEPL